MTTDEPTASEVTEVAQQAMAAELNKLVNKLVLRDTL